MALSYENIGRQAALEFERWGAGLEKNAIYFGKVGMFLIGGIDAPPRCESRQPGFALMKRAKCSSKMPLKVMPENWKEDVRIRLFLRHVASQSARTPLAEFLGTN